MFRIVAGVLAVLLIVCGGSSARLVLGPAILLGVFLCGPPDLRCSRSLAGTAFLLVLGVLLTVSGLPW